MPAAFSAKDAWEVHLDIMLHLYWGIDHVLENRCIIVAVKKFNFFP